MELQGILRRNLDRVQREIEAACRAAHRTTDSVQLVVVTKYVDPPVIEALFEVGARDFGENRPQALLEKATSLADLPIRWHLIGHLQRNKVRRVLPRTSLLHSGDSFRLLEAFNAAAIEAQLRAKVLLEVNIANEASKHGFTENELIQSAHQIAEFSNLDVLGLMGMSGLASSPSQKSAQFRALHQFREKLRSECPLLGSLNELSMGMSDDFKLAIAEGATIVRIGSAIFEGLIS